MREQSGLTVLEGEIRAPHRNCSSDAMDVSALGLPSNSPPQFWRGPVLPVLQNDSRLLILPLCSLLGPAPVNATNHALSKYLLPGYGRRLPVL